EQLRHAYERAVHSATPYLFTVLGPPGIGKSRLASELAASVAGQATVLTGPCLPYGEGITFWPLAEIVRELAGNTSREALLELRPLWAGGKLNATSILLEPLSEADCEALVLNLADAHLDETARARILEAAGGNPLFLEQMLALASEEGAGGELVVPPSIQALLAARIDRLEPGERSLLECASVVGNEFSHGAVAELSPPE